MTSKEREIISKLVSELDEAVGKLLVPSMKDKLVTEAMAQVSQVSFDLTVLL